MQSWAERFPELYAPGYWAWGELDVQFGTEQPPDELISNVHVVARSEGGVVVCRNDLGWRFLPGGTREPDEPILQTARRELLEEAGATLLSDPIWLGAHRADHRRPEPYRPHLPHPVSYWATVVADVAVDAEPGNPEDGEQVVEVLVLPPDEAVTYLAAHPDGVMAETLRLAQAMGLV
ncbi:8-oxo-dGTP diphosphatase [Kribbella amoyensis]|uniref:8-oxo-dGTP diphosphatase n=1 Tax=Kribbella amoyensis TaxID=996641 RepID=A0A561BNT5_9ACTN|nr:NUDIX domain-containing protein [Kribbella amoyensis]TWD80514.1 8-oxo-dGTP diphosphatase [Kribbella amoyensis]